MSETLEQQISILEQQIKDKRTLLEKESPTEIKEAPSDKELVHAIVGEHIQQIAPAHSSGPTPRAGSGQTPLYQDPDIQPVVQNLVNVAFTKGIPEAVKEAVKSNNPAIIDAFHDVLVDELYQALVERKKLEPIK